jgi:hypothetical protein
MPPAGPQWPKSSLCPPAWQPWLHPRLRPRIIAAILLGALSVRFVVQGALLARQLPAAILPGVLELRLASALGAVGLGGCLWWVAKRQVGLAGAIIALLLFVTSPVTQPGAATMLASLGLFGMTYTAVGVAHALQGPRRKWAPRITMMTALTVFTALFDGQATIAALLLSLLAMLYLGESKRRMVPLFFLLWTLAGAFGYMFSVGVQNALGAHFPVVMAGAARWQGYVSGNGLGPVPEPIVLPVAVVLHRALVQGWWAILLAFLIALAGWFTSGRSRYFGNSAPLLAGCLLLALRDWAGGHVLLWALAFALLFVAGVVADWLPVGNQL